jgi:hypothetical protein
MRCVEVFVLFVRRDNTLLFEMVGSFALFSFVCDFRRFAMLGSFQNVLFGACAFWAFLCCAVLCRAVLCRAVLFWAAPCCNCAASVNYFVLFVVRHASVSFTTGAQWECRNEFSSTC